MADFIMQFFNDTWTQNYVNTHQILLKLLAYLVPSLSVIFLKIKAILNPNVPNNSIINHLEDVGKKRAEAKSFAGMSKPCVPVPPLDGPRAVA